MSLYLNYTAEVLMEVSYVSQGGEELCIIDRGDTMYKSQAMKENMMWP